ncbi:hypothetical protein GUI12_03690 [Anaplasmataceae bacterium AB001_6]|nr:hypothetical protein GUI12_03690 [Anaplasmataceae bacterium AB001_6]
MAPEPNDNTEKTITQFIKNVREKIGNSASIKTEIQNILQDNPILTKNSNSLRVFTAITGIKSNESDTTQNIPNAEQAFQDIYNLTEQTAQRKNVREVILGQEKTIIRSIADKSEIDNSENVLDAFSRLYDNMTEQTIAREGRVRSKSLPAIKIPEITQNRRSTPASSSNPNLASQQTSATFIPPLSPQDTSPRPSIPTRQLSEDTSDFTWDENWDHELFNPGYQSEEEISDISSDEGVRYDDNLSYQSEEEISDVSSDESDTLFNHSLEESAILNPENIPSSTQLIKDNDDSIRQSESIDIRTKKDFYNISSLDHTDENDVSPDPRSNDFRYLYQNFPESLENVPVQDINNLPNIPTRSISESDYEEEDFSFPHPDDLAHLQSREDQPITPNKNFSPNGPSASDILMSDNVDKTSIIQPTQNSPQNDDSFHSASSSRSQSPISLQNDDNFHSAPSSRSQSPISPQNDDDLNILFDNSNPQRRREIQDRALFKKVDRKAYQDTLDKFKDTLTGSTYIRSSYDGEAINVRLGPGVMGEDTIRNVHRAYTGNNLKPKIDQLASIVAQGKNFDASNLSEAKQARLQQLQRDMQEYHRTNLADQQFEPSNLTLNYNSNGIPLVRDNMRKKEGYPNDIEDPMRKFIHEEMSEYIKTISSNNLGLDDKEHSDYLIGGLVNLQAKGGNFSITADNDGNPNIQIKVPCNKLPSGAYDAVAQQDKHKDFIQRIRILNEEGRGDEITQLLKESSEGIALANDLTKLCQKEISENVSGLFANKGLKAVAADDYYAQTCHTLFRKIDIEKVVAHLIENENNRAPLSDVSISIEPLEEPQRRRTILEVNIGIEGIEDEVSLNKTPERNVGTDVGVDNQMSRSRSISRDTPTPGADGNQERRDSNVQPQPPQHNIPDERVLEFMEQLDFAQYCIPTLKNFRTSLQEEFDDIFPLENMDKAVLTHAECIKAMHEKINTALDNDNLNNSYNKEALHEISQGINSLKSEVITESEDLDILQAQTVDILQKELDESLDNRSDKDSRLNPFNDQLKEMLDYYNETTDKFNNYVDTLQDVFKNDPEIVDSLVQMKADLAEEKDQYITEIANVKKELNQYSELKNGDVLVTELLIKTINSEVSNITDDALKATYGDKSFTSQELQEVVKSTSDDFYREAEECNSAIQKRRDAYKAAVRSAYILQEREEEREEERGEEREGIIPSGEDRSTNSGRGNNATTDTDLDSQSSQSSRGSNDTSSPSTGEPSVSSGRSNNAATNTDLDSQSSQSPRGSNDTSSPSTGEDRSTNSGRGNNAATNTDLDSQGNQPSRNGNENQVSIRSGTSQSQTSLSAEQKKLLDETEALAKKASSVAVKGDAFELMTFLDKAKTISERSKDLTINNKETGGIVQGLSERQGEIGNRSVEFGHRLNDATKEQLEEYDVKIKDLSEYLQRDDVKNHIKELNMNPEIRQKLKDGNNGKPVNLEQRSEVLQTKIGQLSESIQRQLSRSEGREIESVNPAISNNIPREPDRGIRSLGRTSGTPPDTSLNGSIAQGVSQQRDPNRGGEGRG